MLEVGFLFEARQRVIIVVAERKLQPRGSKLRRSIDFPKLRRDTRLCQQDTLEKSSIGSQQLQEV
jgi:hypothetical protein